MPQATDIVLDGAGYMLWSGTGAMQYKRAQDGVAEGRTGRITQKDFFGGQRRAYQLERDSAWGGIGAGPAYGGQGVEPWPYSLYVNLNPSQPSATPNTRIPHARIGDYLFFAVGGAVFRTVIMSNQTWAAPTLMASGATPITSLTYYSGGILVGYGSAFDLLYYTAPGFTNGIPIFAGERGGELVSYGGSAMWTDKATTAGHYAHRIQLVTGSGMEYKLLDSPVRRLVVAQSRVIAATDAGLYSFSGRVNEVDVRNPAYNPNDANETDPPTIRAQRWSGEFEPFFQHGSTVATDDFAFITAFGGKLYAWVGKTVMEFTEGGDRAGWRDTGLSGNNCFGACVAAGYLLVCIESRDRRSQVWAWDGAGWWLVLDQAGMQYPWCWPMPLSGAGGYDALVFLGNSQGAHLIRLVWRNDQQGTFPDGGAANFVTSMIDAGERDKDKAWRKVGAVFAAPEPRGVAGSGDVVSVALDYSIDGGGTWINAVPLTHYNNNVAASHNHTLNASIASTVATSRFIQLRVRWESALFWAPVLAGVWAEFETLDSPARRRKWSFAITAKDQVINRDGVVLAKTGRELIAELWSKWWNGSTFTFRDIDHDYDPTERQVRIVGISEAVAAPDQHGMWGDAVISLTLVQV